MPRAASSIQTEIDAIEARLASVTSESKSADGVSTSGPSRANLEARLDQLYRQLDRINGKRPLFTRGRVTGIGNTY